MPHKLLSGKTLFIVIFGVFCTNNMVHPKKVGMQTFKRLWGEAVKKKYI